MIENMVKCFGAGVAFGMGIGVVAWLIAYACVSIRHVFQSMS